MPSTEGVEVLVGEDAALGPPGGARGIEEGRLLPAIRTPGTRRCARLRHGCHGVVQREDGEAVAMFGGKFVADVLLGVGKSQAIKVVNDQATKVIGGLLKK